MWGECLRVVVVVAVVVVLFAFLFLLWFIQCALILLCLTDTALRMLLECDMNVLP